MKEQILLENNFIYNGDVWINEVYDRVISPESLKCISEKVLQSWIDTYCEKFAYELLNEGK